MLKPTTRRTFAANIPIIDTAIWKNKLLHWAATFPVCVYLDSNTVDAGSQKMPVETDWDCLVAMGSKNVLECPVGQAFEALARWRKEIGSDWHFGFMAYDLKNELETLRSDHWDGIKLPDLAFFQPDIVIAIRQKHIEVQTLDADPEAVWQQVKDYCVHENEVKGMPVYLSPRMSKNQYTTTVEAIREHIVAGDLYEMNLCQEFYAAQAIIDPVAVFERLNALAKAPFSAFMRWRDKFLLSASPERFLKKTGQKVISQPIKGTRKRGNSTKEDEAIRHELAQSPKDRAENVMIVDLVRNDLAKHCVPGTVRVEDLFGIYTFNTVHQMITTVCGQIKPGTDTLQLLRDAFPMGSMTGAPKVMAMQLIEKYECTRRGLYAGTIGYFAPNDDFDFNVVIRSILYNASDAYLSVQAGGAIVYDSDPESEYAECMLKAQAMVNALK